MNKISNFARIIGAVLLLGVLAGQSQAQPASAARQVVVNGVAFQGNHTYTASDLSGLIASEIGKPMTLKDIQALAARIEAFYHEAGYPLVKVVVPRQTFADDTPVRMVVLEGQLGQVRVEGNDRYRADYVRDALSAAGVRADQPVSLERVERALTRVNRQSGIEAGRSPGLHRSGGEGRGSPAGGRRHRVQQLRQQGHRALPRGAVVAFPEPHRPWR